MIVKFVFESLEESHLGIDDDFFSLMEWGDKLDNLKDLLPA